MTETGVEGTVLGTLVMPYCSGIGNLVFVFVVFTNGQPATEVMTNCLVNNVTNMTLLIGLPTILWGMRVVPRPDANAKKKLSGTALPTRAVVTVGGVDLTFEIDGDIELA